MGSGKQGGMSSVGTSEDGEESSSVQDDDDVDMLTEMLSTVQPPQVQYSCRFSTVGITNVSDQGSFALDCTVQPTL